MKKYIIALFVTAFSTIGMNYVLDSAEKGNELSLENVEALACTMLSENGGGGTSIWCNCDTPTECGTIYYPSYQVVYGRPERH